MSFDNDQMTIQKGHHSVQHTDLHDLDQLNSAVGGLDIQDDMSDKLSFDKSLMEIQLKSRQGTRIRDSQLHQAMLLGQS